MNLELLCQKDNFLDHVTEQLGSITIDFAERMTHIKTLHKAHEVHHSAAVMLLLHFKENELLSGRSKSNFYFQLIKRSSKVSQPGDLGCPGGMLDRFVDPLIKLLILCKIIPILQGNALTYAKKRDLDTFKIMNLFLATAVRESWEEIGLSPFNILSLGALPTYSLTPAQRTIFPFVGLVKTASPFRLNYEVEKIIEIPVNAFFDKANFAYFIIESRDPSLTPELNSKIFPCLVYPDAEGHEEILWGATYKIIINFLSLVLGYEEPDLNSRRIISRTLAPDYMRYRNK